MQTALGSPDEAKEPWYEEYKQKYCFNSEFLAAVERVRKAANSKFGAPFAEERIDYILKTGANWSGPIKEFRLVVDKGAADNLVSFCGDDVKKIGETRFEMRKSDYTPDGNLSVLILRKLPINRDRRRRLVAHEHRLQRMRLELPALVRVQHAVVHQVRDQHRRLGLRRRGPDDGAVEAHDAQHPGRALAARFDEQVVDQMARGLDAADRGDRLTLAPCVEFLDLVATLKAVVAHHHEAIGR